MAQQFILTGNVFLSDDGHVLLEGRVRAFDRDLPSLERRGAVPQLLGESPLDANGRYRIEYTDEQFRKGEGETPALRRASNIGADLSFHIFDKTGRELTITRLIAFDREFQPDQIIFNASAELDVGIYVDVHQQARNSEYETLIALLTPIIQDIPLEELTEEDVVFLINELGIEQQLDDQNRIEWLHRSALLAQLTNLPIEAFYGWGREDVPAPFNDIARFNPSDLQSLLDKIISRPEDELRAALERAITENIIPAQLRDREDEIVRQLKRRNQMLQTVVAQLLDDETKAALAGYTVTTYDQDAGNENRGLDITDNEGTFFFGFFLPRDLPPDSPPRNFSFQVTTPDGETVPVNALLAIHPQRLESEVVPVKVKVPKPQTPPFEERLQEARLQVPPELLEWLKGQEISTFADIRRKGGLSYLPGLPEIDPGILHQIEALADLDRVSSAVQVNKVLLEKGYDSVLAIADAPYSEFISVVSDENAALTPLESAKVHVIATIQTNLLNNILAGMAADISNGFELPDSKE